MVTGEKLTSFPLVSDFLTPNVQPSSVTKSGPKQVEANRSQGTGGGAAGGATRPHLTLDSLFLSWVLVTQRLEATPEPGRELREEGLVHCQYHLGSEVERLGCLRSPRLRPHPATLYQTMSSECTSCAHSPDTPRDPTGAGFDTGFRLVCAHPRPVVWLAWPPTLGTCPGVGWFSTVLFGFLDCR